MAERPIVLVTGEYPPDVGGLADYTARLRAALRTRGRHVEIVTHHRRAAPPEPAEPHVHRAIHRWDASGVAHLLRRVPGDAIVHLEYQAAAFDLLGDICLAPWLLRRLRPDTRVATTFHDVRVPYVFPKAGRLRPLALWLMARSSHAVLAADHADLSWLGGPSPCHHWVPIGSNLQRRPPPGYDPAVFRAALGVGAQDAVVVYFGLLTRGKGLATLHAAFRAIGKQLAAHAPARTAWLLLLGGAASASAPDDRLAAPRGDGVISSGYLDNEALSAYLLAADVALLPYDDGASARRGSLLACAEHGLPIVTTSGPGLDSRGLDLAGSVLACPPGDAEALAQAVASVLRDPTLHATLAGRSARLAERVGWAAIADRHLAIYAGLSG